MFDAREQMVSGRQRRDHARALYQGVKDAGCQILSFDFPGSSHTKRTFMIEGRNWLSTLTFLLPLSLLLLLPSTHNTENFLVFAWPPSETTVQHALSSRSPALRIRVSNPPKTRDFQTTTGSLCIRPAALNDSQFRTLLSCSPFVYCEDLVATNSPTTEQLHVAV
jgi:hypothetical protein